jgi:hypothetical protein
MKIYLLFFYFAFGQQVCNNGDLCKVIRLQPDMFRGGVRLIETEVCVCNRRCTYYGPQNGNNWIIEYKCRPYQRHPFCMRNGTCAFGESQSNDLVTVITMIRLNCTCRNDGECRFFVQNKTALMFKCT